MSHTIYHDVAIDASSTEVFACISQPEKLMDWWPLRCSGSPEVGTLYNYYFDDEYDWYGIVTHMEPDSSLHIKMTKSDEDWGPTSFGFNIVNEDRGVTLQFFHEGWVNQNHHYRRTSFCWAMLLNGLKDYVENGIIVPFEKRA